MKISNDKSMGTDRARSIDARTQYSYSKDDDVYLVRLRRYGIPRVAETG